MQHTYLQQNIAQCKDCEQVLCSSVPDDRKECKCGGLWISGGFHKLIRGGTSAFNELSTYITEDDEEWDYDTDDDSDEDYDDE